MNQKRRRKVEFIIRSFDNKHLSNAQLSITSQEDQPIQDFSFEYDPSRMLYVVNDLPPGDYQLTVTAPGFEASEQKLVVPPGDLKDNVVLGTQGMLHYYRGQHKIPFEPPSDLIGVSLNPGRTEKQEEDLLGHSANIGLKLMDNIPNAVLQDSVLLFRIPTSVNDEANQKMLDELMSHPSVRNAGPVVHLWDETVTFLTRQLIAKFHEEIGAEEISDILNKFALDIVRPVRYSKNTFLLSSRRAASFRLLDTCEQLVSTGMVEYAEPNLVVTAVDFQINPTDFLYPEQWPIPLPNLPNAWQFLRTSNPSGVVPGNAGDLTFGGEDVVIAVLDRGIQSANVGGLPVASHPDFAGTVTGGANKVSQFYDFANMVANNNNPPNDHGMGCASVAGALANNASTVAGVNEGVAGSAPNCRLMGLIRPAGGTEQQYADAFVWIAGFNPGWVIDNVNYFPGTVFPAPPAPAADIITNSFGWSSWPITGLMMDTMDFVTTNGRGGLGTLMFFAAGNGNTTTSTQQGLGAHPRTFAIAASTLANDGVTEIRASYSNFGDEIEICAPSSDRGVHNPPISYGVISADLLNGGNMPGQPAQQTTLSAAVAIGSAALNVANSAGMAAGQSALIGIPGAVGTEAQAINGVPNVNQITVSPVLNAHPIGTQVSAGPRNYRNNFGGTSAATPFAAGIAALILSINPELTLAAVRDILRQTADKIDFANTDPIGQWVDTNGDGGADFSQWYGYGRVNADAAVQAAKAYKYDDFVVVWEDDNNQNNFYQIYARSFREDGVSRFADMTVNTVASGQQLKPAIGMDANCNIVVVWEDDKDQNGFYQIYARGLAADGTQRFADLTVNSVASGQQFKPAIAVDRNGNFVVVWEDDKDQNGFYQIYARGFNADGTERFNDMTVNSVATGQQRRPDVAMATNGDFVVVWEDDKDKNGYYQIYARGFRANGTQKFADFTVNSVASGQQFKPAVAMDSGGNFVVVWEDDKDQNGYFQIYARGFNADGTERFNDMTVNSVATGQQRRPDVAMATNGDFVVVWEDDKDKNGYYQIYARGFRANGTQKFADFTVNSVASGQQFKPAVAMDSGGNFVVVWEDDKDQNGYFQIYARGFNADGTERFNDMTVNSVATGQQRRPDVALQRFPRPRGCSLVLAERLPRIFQPWLTSRIPARRI